MPIFLFTDIENSTRLWEKYREVMGSALSRHDAILLEEVARHGGKIIKHRGDGIFAVFEAGEPLACALAIQNAMQHQSWGEVGGLRIRMALHAGTAERRGDDYFGPAVNRTARVLDIGWGGQTLVTPEAAEACRLPDGATLEDLGVQFLKDLSEPQQVLGLLHPDLPLREFPPLRSLSTHPNNLPSQATPFIGRGKELFDITKLLENPECKLLTLLGPGGIGKTRLAIQAASERSDAFSHGAYFVELAPLASPDLLVPAIAQALKYTFYGQGDPKAQLLGYLREKKMLLALDNFEHLLDGAPLVSEILAAAPGVKIIATSRERLSLMGEWIVEVEGMQVPLSETADLESYAAVQLFVETARRVSPGFALTEEEAPYVVHVCQLLMGMPLGIELAASWARSLSCEEIAREISESLDFLATQMRDMPERHRSLRAVFDHSWKLLSEYEKSALKKIAVFRGAFTKEAAKAVSGASLPILSLLLDKSLLKKTSGGRYEIHPMVRQYAEERWEENAEERERVRDLHALYYAEFLASREVGLKGGKQKESLDQISDEFENVRAAWWRLVEKRNTEQIGKALHLLYLFFRMRSRFHEGNELFEKSLEAMAGDAVIAHRLKARLGAFAVHLARHAKAEETMMQCLGFFRHAGLRQEVAFSLYILGSICLLTGRYDEAIDFYRQSLDESGKLGDRFAMINALVDLGSAHLTLGDYGKAESFYNQSLQISSDIGDKFGMSMTLLQKGNVAYSAGNHEEAFLIFHKSLAVTEELGDKRMVMFSKFNLGSMARLLGNHEEAKRLLEESLDLSEEIGYRPIQAGAREYLALVLNATGEREKAMAILSQSLAISREDRSSWNLVSCLKSMGNVAMDSGDTAAAGKYFREGLEMAKQNRMVPFCLEILAGLLPILASENNREIAAELIGIISNHPMSTRMVKDKVARFCSNDGKMSPISSSPERLFEVMNQVLALLTTTDAS